MSSFREAWINQFITTGEIETILKASQGDFSLEALHKVSTEKFGSGNVHIVDLKDKDAEFGSDRVALGVNDTLIFFKDGIYYGSKSNLRNH
ncbi:hypothetical protein HNQ53_003552 [Microbulbifer hydrolyticus]|uniref:Uncharacterized protein n=1 Tax=Microbulbifer hydrolyticus TaxID=48074 RepID=A0AA89PEE4_9GAMM|nr:hypothetical protein [Microbulbifer hydrolyticus]